MKPWSEDMRKAARKPSLLEAALAVEEWWLTSGVDLLLGGAPACIFMLREALAQEKAPPEGGAKLEETTKDSSS